MKNMPTGPAFGSETVLGMPTKYYYCGNAVACSPYQLWLLDLSTTESGNLDYTLPFISENSLSGLSVVYGVYGQRTGALRNDAQTGSAVFAGTAFGEMLVMGQGQHATKARLWMTANFASGAINGSVTDFVGYTMNRTENARSTLPAKPDFDFTASLTSSDGTFSGAATSRSDGMGLTGSVAGSFFGLPGMSPDEVGLSYVLGRLFLMFT